MNISIITSNHLRHKAFSKILCDAFDIKTVIFEHKKKMPGNLPKKEQTYYKDLQDWQPPCRHVVCARGAVNGQVIQDILEKEKPDYLFIFGCSLLKENIFSIPRKGCVNIHTGLVQYFRGVDSSLWAVYEEKPEAIGATVHFVDKTIDGGNIIAQRRTNLQVDDDLDDVFLKTCNTGFELLVEKVPQLIAGNVRPQKLTKKGKLYQNKDYNNKIFQEAKQKLSKVIKDYLKNKKDIDLSEELIE